MIRACDRNSSRQIKKSAFLAFLLVLMLRSAAEDGIPYSYTAVLFKDNHPETISQGHLSEAVFQKWFVVGPLFVTGARVEASPGSPAFGALFVYSNTITLTMPFYQIEGDVCLCQSPKYGEPPQFRILEHSQEDFVLTLKLKLKELERSEVQPPAI